MRLEKLAVVLAAGLLIAGPAAAQRPGGGFGPGRFGGGLTGLLGQNTQLQEELKMSKEQVEKVTEALAKVRADLRDETAKLFDRNTSAEEREKIGKKLGEANAKAVGAVLKPEQLKRLHQIENQQAGAGLFAKEDVQKALKLSDSQKEKIATINKDLQKGLSDLSAGGFNPEAFTKRQALEKEATDGIVKLLDAGQKAALKDLEGEPFELRRGGFGGFGGGGFGGGFGGRRGGTPQAGQVMPQAVQDTLKLTAEQKKRLEELQKEVDGKLGKILTDEQKKQLKDMQQAPGRGRPAGGDGGAPGRPE
jgi:Spy/CpxP family protein refolding chaperone